MTMLRVLGLSILIGCAAAMLVWFGWGLIANLRAMRPAPAEPEPAEEAPPDRAKTERA